MDCAQPYTTTRHAPTRERSRRGESDDRQLWELRAELAQCSQPTSCDRKVMRVSLMNLTNAPEIHTVRVSRPRSLLTRAATPVTGEPTATRRRATTAHTHAIFTLRDTLVTLHSTPHGRRVGSKPEQETSESRKINANACSRIVFELNPESSRLVARNPRREAATRRLECRARVTVRTPSGEHLLSQA